MSGLAPEWVRLAQKGQIWDFLISVLLLKLIFKSPRFVLFGVNLILFSTQNVLKLSSKCPDWFNLRQIRPYCVPIVLPVSLWFNDWVNGVPLLSGRARNFISYWWHQLSRLRRIPHRPHQNLITFPTFPLAQIFYLILIVWEYRSNMALIVFASII